MKENLFTEADIEQMQAKGIRPETILAQIASFKKGIPPLKLNRPCTAGDGIIVVPESQQASYRKLFQDAASQGRVMKFVPASGAATRMFKSLHAIRNRLLNGDIPQTGTANDPDLLSLQKFTDALDRFAFYGPLESKLSQNGFKLDRLLKESKILPILDYLLTPVGLNYGQLPKGMILFHRYPEGPRSAFEEHLVEAAAYARDGQGLCRIHFTITPTLEKEIKDHVDSKCPRFESAGSRMSIGYSSQQPSTDTLAVNGDNTPFRNSDGRLLFRPAGHGALLDNLNQLQGDIVFIKNIDNVVPDHLKEETICYKEVLGGLLVDYQSRIHTYLKKLQQQAVAPQETEAMLMFSQQHLNMTPPEELFQQSHAVKTQYLNEQLNRPIRVCGMVRNVGEPGGGPFWVEQPDGKLTPQIVESVSIDLTATDQQAQWQNATHFNPVDVVCGLRDFQQQPFDLGHFMDPEAGFISNKSKDGKELKALELPGLWNGSMAKWITLFVEVPLTTFNPVKTVFDLLRPEHQSLCTPDFR
jgi:hypothetical protein